MTRDRRSPSGRCRRRLGLPPRRAARDLETRPRRWLRRHRACGGMPGRRRPVAPPGGTVLVEGVEVQRDVMGRQRAEEVVELGQARAARDVGRHRDERVARGGRPRRRRRGCRAGRTRRTAARRRRTGSGSTRRSGPVRPSARWPARGSPRDRPGTAGRSCTSRPAAAAPGSGSSGRAPDRLDHRREQGVW